MNLKELRISFHISQKTASEILGISLRSYKSYENDAIKQNGYKYQYFCQKLSEKYKIDEEHGLLTIETIKSVCQKIFLEYDVNFCYLFGSYAKGKEKEISDVDLLIDTSVTGLDFFELVERLRESLGKKVDLLKLNQLNDNEELAREILKVGIRIYG